MRLKFYHVTLQCDSTWESSPRASFWKDSLLVCFSPFPLSHCISTSGFWPNIVSGTCSVPEAVLGSKNIEARKTLSLKSLQASKDPRTCRHLSYSAA